MTKEQWRQKMYAQTAQRLARGGIKDPTAQIIALAEEIERYRDKIRALEELLQKATETKTPSASIMPFPKFRYTHYNEQLGRYVVPCLYKCDGSRVGFNFKIEPGERITDGRGNIITLPGVEFVFGEVIDRLAELENGEGAKP